MAAMSLVCLSVLFTSCVCWGQGRKAMTWGDQSSTPPPHDPILTPMPAFLGEGQAGGHSIGAWLPRQLSSIGEELGGLDTRFVWTGNMA